MTVTELSAGYEAAAELLRARLRQLRKEYRVCGDKDRRAALKRRIYALEPMLFEMNELAELTARYYDRGYYRHAAYRI